MEAILQVQRAWLYLENVFLGSDDIREQLPSEAALFEGVHASVVRARRELHATGNAMAATTRKGLLATFQARLRAGSRPARVSGWACLSTASVTGSSMHACSRLGHPCTCS